LGLQVPYICSTMVSCSSHSHVFLLPE
jgi:hypothetical protein